MTRIVADLALIEDEALDEFGGRRELKSLADEPALIKRLRAVFREERARRKAGEVSPEYVELAIDQASDEELDDLEGLCGSYYVRWNTGEGTKSGCLLFASEFMGLVQAHAQREFRRRGAW